MKKNNPIFKGFNSPATHQSHVLLNRGFACFTWLPVGSTTAAVAAVAPNRLRIIWGMFENHISIIHMS